MLTVNDVYAKVITSFYKNKHNKKRAVQRLKIVKEIKVCEINNCRKAH